MQDDTEDLFEDPEGRERRSSVGSSSLIGRTNDFVTPRASQDLDSLLDGSNGSATPNRTLPETLAQRGAAEASGAYVGSPEVHCSMHGMHASPMAEGVSSLRRMAQGLSLQCCIFSMLIPIISPGK